MNPRQVLSVEVSDPKDDSFLSQKRFAAADFTLMKQEQHLEAQLKFEQLGDVVVRLLQEAVSGDVLIDASLSSDSSGRVCEINFVRKVRLGYNWKCSCS